MELANYDIIFELFVVFNFAYSVRLFREHVNLGTPKLPEIFLNYIRIKIDFEKTRTRVLQVGMKDVPDFPVEDFYREKALEIEGIEKKLTEETNKIQSNENDKRFAVCFAAVHLYFGMYSLIMLFMAGLMENNRLVDSNEDYWHIATVEIWTIFFLVYYFVKSIHPRRQIKPYGQFQMFALIIVPSLILYRYVDTPIQLSDSMRMAICIVAVILAAAAFLLYLLHACATILIKFFRSGWLVLILNKKINYVSRKYTEDEKYLELTSALKKFKKR